MSHHPESIEERVNSRLAKLKSKVTIYWDGAIIERDAPSGFDVYLGDDELALRVEYHPSALEVVEYRGSRRVVHTGLRYFEDIADYLADAERKGELATAEEDA